MTLAAQIRLLIGLAVIATLFAFGFGLWVHWPWLRGEHDRLDPAFQVLIWLGDAACLSWFVWFGIWYAALGRPLPDTVAGAAESRYLLASLLVALGIDLTITAITGWQEMAGKGRALQVQGQIVGGRPTVNEKKAYLVCRFADGDGAWHESHLQVLLSNQPLVIQEAIRGGRFPIPVLTWYDPHWPERCWLENFDNEESNRLQLMSALLLFLQALCMPIALDSKLVVWKTTAGLIPLYRAIPFWAALSMFFLSAIAKFCEGEC